MIIARIMGGLGNQMFQYAVGRRVALETGAVLKLDLSWFDKYSARGFALQNWNVVGERASYREILARRGLKTTLADRGLRRMFGFGLPSTRSYVPEPRLLGEAPLVCADDAYLDGYWQSETYFAPASEQLRCDFTPKAEISARILELARLADCEASVSVHVRRGDYVANGRASRVHGVCGPDYYRRALEIIAQAVDRPRYLLFSDDPAWAAGNIALDGEVADVSSLACEPHEELWLMSRCRYHIIANSTFSWWGAWLDPRPDKLVVAPERWFAGRREEHVVPVDWRRA